MWSLASVPLSLFLYLSSSFISLYRRQLLQVLYVQCHTPHDGRLDQTKWLTRLKPYTSSSTHTHHTPVRFFVVVLVVCLSRSTRFCLFVFALFYVLKTSPSISTSVLESSCSGFLALSPREPMTSCSLETPCSCGIEGTASSWAFFAPFRA